MLRDAVCTSDAAVVGTVVRKRVVASDNQRTLFTAYSIRVDDWLRPLGANNAPVPILVGQLGGHANANGLDYKVALDDLLFGRKYVLLLDRLGDDPSVYTISAKDFRLIAPNARSNAPPHAMSKNAPVELRRGLVPFSSITTDFRNFSAECPRGL
jgi:hypothetical protein